MIRMAIVQLLIRLGTWRCHILTAAVAMLATSGCNRTGVRQTTLSCENCNVIIISLTNVRKGHVSAYGYDRETTPNIDRFFANATRFDNAFAPASWTLPVLASLHTAKYPYTHGLMSRYNEMKLADEELTLTEILKQRGYRTAAFTGGGDHNRRYNVAQGFDTYVDESNYADYGIRAKDEKPATGALTYLPLEPLVPFAQAWLEENADDPFFLVVQGYDAHCPFTPRPPYDTLFDPDYVGGIDFSVCLWTFEPVERIERDGVSLWPVKTSGWRPGMEDILLSERDIEKMVALYDGEIAQADASLRPLFDTIERLDLTKRTIIIFMAEHGDLFGEHGRFMRGGPLRGTFYDQVLNFPLLLLHPDIDSAQQVSANIETIDLMPTLLELLGVPDPKAASREGRSFVPMIMDPTLAPKRDVFAASRYTACSTLFVSGLSTAEAVRSGDWKLIVEAIFDLKTHRPTKNYELYNIAEDPQERIDLYDAQPLIAAKLERLLRTKFPANPGREDEFRCPGY